MYIFIYLEWAPLILALVIDFENSCVCIFFFARGTDLFPYGFLRTHQRSASYCRGFSWLVSAEDSSSIYMCTFRDTFYTKHCLHCGSSLVVVCIFRFGNLEGQASRVLLCVIESSKETKQNLKRVRPAHATTTIRPLGAIE